MIHMLVNYSFFVYFFFSSRRRHTRLVSDWSSDVCSSDLVELTTTDGTTLVLNACAGIQDERCSIRGCQLHTRGVAAVNRRSEERRVGKECKSRGTLDE